VAETTLSELRRDLKNFCDRAVDDREPVRVRRRNGKDVVLLAAEEFDSISQTAHLLASPKNARRLRAALGRARRGTTKPMTAEKLRANLGL
jgi:antitoxin YefM